MGVMVYTLFFSIVLQQVRLFQTCADHQTYKTKVSSQLLKIFTNSDCWNKSVIMRSLSNGMLIWLKDFLIQKYNTYEPK